MPPAADPDNGLEELLELWSVPNADALHRLLVLSRPVRGSTDAFEPLSLLRRHHDTEPESSLTTALLLLTDRRWRHGIARLVRHIAESSILDAEQLDVLARTFIAAADAVFWRIPDEWFTGGIDIVIDPNGDEPGGTEPDDEQEGPVVVRRDVYPPLRRWSAAHLVARQPSCWSALWRRADELDPRGAAAVLAGLLDGLEVLTPDARAFIVARATAWPDHTVRRLALDHIAGHHGSQVAARLARNDRNARIREWAASLVAADAPARPASPTRSHLRPQQSTLF